ncbi:BTAD domain-containing putative transcriptional regulator [Streptomyces sp. NPDC001678]|uniref:AfsR/SARP family transcriptional regulator n=1 Tax=Streptomyces sp. NPDC001678 TaxID=3364599 RepID=UPI00368A4B00
MAIGTSVPEAPEGLWFSVLGPLRAWRSGAELPLGPPQQRAMLAMLLLSEGRTVSADRLIDALWGEEPPHAALGTVRTYAYRLRRLLGADVLTSESGGYRLRVPADRVDAARCEALAAEAAARRAEGDAEGALRALGQALGLWRGDVLLVLPGPYAERQRTRWQERKVELLETRLEIDLEQGRHREVVEELAGLTAAYPLRERFAELRMTALCRSGRQADALKAYDEARRVLAEEVGVDPGPALRELHRRVLAADPALVPAAPAPGAPTSSSLAVPSPGASSLAGRLLAERRPGRVETAPALWSPAPRQLPFTASDFTGREAETATVAEALLRPDGMPVVAISGLGGVGKTELAVRTAHRLADRFPDGQLHAVLHDDDGRPTPPEETLEGFLRALGVPAQAVPAGLAERTALFRSAVAGRRVLIVLDNARDTEQIRPLLPVDGCAVLVTSRTRLDPLPGMRFVALGVLTPEESLELFTRVVGADRVAAEPEDARRGVAACGHLPLAIRLLASRLACRPGWGIGWVVDQLEDEHDRRRLDVLRSGTLDVETTFRFSYERLDAAQARAFRLLAALRLPHLPLDAVAAALELSRHEAEDVAESLVDCSLLETPAPERYGYHGLLSAFAQGLCGPEGEPEHIRAALGRVVRRYHGDPGVDPCDVAAALQRYAEGAATTGPERALTAGREHALTAGRAAGAPDLALAAELLLDSTLRHDCGHATRRLGRAALALLGTALAEGDPAAEARVRLALGRLLLEMGTATTPALAELIAARDLCARHALPPVVRAHTHSALGACFARAGRHEDAAHAFRAAATLHDTLGSTAAVVPELLGLARSLAGAGRATDAGNAAATARALCRTLNDSGLEALALSTLGTLAEERGDLDGAVGHFRAALALLRPEERRRTGRTLMSLTHVLRAAGRAAEAADAAARAVEAFTADGDQYGAGLALAELGHATARLPDPDTARLHWSEAHVLLARIGAPEARSLRELSGDHDRSVRTEPWPSWTPARM